MEPEDKARIEKEAISYIIQETGYQVLPEHDHWKKAYIAGATAERNMAIDDCIKLFDSNEYYYGDIIQNMLESLKQNTL